MVFKNPNSNKSLIEKLSGVSVIDSLVRKVNYLNEKNVAHQLLIQGYMRETAELVIPSEIILLIILFCPLYQQMLFNYQDAFRQIYFIMKDKSFDCIPMCITFDYSKESVDFWASRSNKIFDSTPIL